MAEDLCNSIQAVLDTLGNNQEKIDKIQMCRDEITHIDKLKVHLDLMHELNAEKNTFLDNTEHLLQRKNDNIAENRVQAQKVYNLCVEYLPKKQEIATIVQILEKDLESNTAALQRENQTLINTVQNLTNILNNLKSEQRDKQKDVKNVEKSLFDENERLKTKLKMLEQDEAKLLAAINEYDENLLEKESQEIINNLSVLNEDQEKIRQEICQLDQNGMFEEKMEILKKSSTAITEEILELEEKHNNLVQQEIEYTQAIQNLEECEAKVKNDLEKTVIFWEDIFTNTDPAMKKMQFEIDEIRRDIEERKTKYTMMEDQKTNMNKELQKVEDFISQNPLENLKSAVEEAEIKLETLNICAKESTENHDDLIIQYKNSSNEIITVTQTLESQKLEHVELSKKFEEVTVEENKRLYELKNKIIVDQKCLEKDNASLESAKIKIESQVKELDVQINCLKEAITNLSQERDNKTSKIADLKSKEEQTRREFKKTQIQKKETAKKLEGLIAKKTPTKKLNTSFKKSHSPKNESQKKTESGFSKMPTEKKLSDTFTRPKTPEPKKQKLEEKSEKKTDFDSDSSQEDSTIKWKKVLTKKNKWMF